VDANPAVEVSAPVDALDELTSSPLEKGMILSRASLRSSSFRLLSHTSTVFICFLCFGLCSTRCERKSAAVFTRCGSGVSPFTHQCGRTV
jgi:hypothetical protein